MSWLRGALLVITAIVIAPAVVAQHPAEDKQAKAETHDLAQIKAERDAASKLFLKDWHNVGNRKKYVFLTVKLGMHTMYAVSLPPHDKYPVALKLFKEALRVDPNNRDAMMQKNKIESVYRVINARKKG